MSGIPETKVYRRADFVETSEDTAVPVGGMDELVSLRFKVQFTLFFLIDLV